MIKQHRLSNLFKPWRAARDEIREASERLVQIKEQNAKTRGEIAKLQCQTAVSSTKAEVRVSQNHIAQTLFALTYEGKGT